MKGFTPLRNYDTIFVCNRKPETNKYFQNQQNIKYDLIDKDSNNKILEAVNDQFDDISIVFASFYSNGLSNLSDISESILSMGINIVQPLNLFSELSLAYPNALINGVFISTMYASLCPNPNNYKDKQSQNPLYYGTFKSAVDQGLRWLSVQNPLHTFNSISLGPMPKDKVFSDDPNLIKNLKTSLPSNMFVERRELHQSINFLLSEDNLSIRGISLKLDGGYSLW